MGIGAQELPLSFKEKVDNLKRGVEDLEGELMTIQRREFDIFFRSFIKKLSLDYRIAFKRLSDSIFSAIIHSASAKREFESHEFLAFITMALTKNQEMKIFDEFNDVEKVEFIKILKRFWSSCPVSNVLIIWQQPFSIGNLKMFNLLANKYGKLLEELFKEHY